MYTIMHYNLGDDPIAIDNPTPEQIIAAFESRHFDRQSNLALYSKRMLIAYPEHCVDVVSISRCTSNRYRVQHNHFLENGYYTRHLIDPQADRKARAVRYRSGNGEIFSERVKDTVEFDTALRIALYFAQTDTLPDDVTWNHKVK